MKTKQSKSVAIDTTSSSIFEGLILEERVKAEVNDIQAQLERSSGGLTSSDHAQLRDLAVVSQKIEDCHAMTAIAKQNGEASSWAALTRLYQALLDSRRKILADLRATRSKRTGVDESAAERKSKQRSGSGWQGVI
jgi:septal ring factor EnvC (AmiA/AmiB activator)